LLVVVVIVKQILPAPKIQVLLAALERGSLHDRLIDLRGRGMSQHTGQAPFSHRRRRQQPAGSIMLRCIHTALTRFQLEFNFPPGVEKDLLG